MNGPGTDSLVTALLNGLWQGMLVACALALLFRWKRIANAATRHAVLMVGLVAILSLPLIHWLSSTSAAVPEGSFAIGGTVSSPDGLRIGGGAWTGWLLAGWGLVVGVAGLRLARAFHRLLGLARSSERPPKVFEARFRELAETVGGTRRLSLRVSDAISQPIALGLGRALVLFPRRLLDRLGARDRDALLLHEIAHLVRRDDWGNLLQQVALVVYPFHPALHWLSRHMAFERELACDEWVVHFTRAPVHYAGCLTRLVEQRSAPGLVSGVGSSTSQMARRIQMLLSSKIPPHAGLDRTFLGLAVVMTSLGLIACARGKKIEVEPVQVRASSKIVTIAEHREPVKTQDRSVVKRKLYEHKREAKKEAQEAVREVMREHRAVMREQRRVLREQKKELRTEIRRSLVIAREAQREALQSLRESRAELSALPAIRNEVREATEEALRAIDEAMRQIGRELREHKNDRR